MKLGTMKSQMHWSLEQTDLAICHSGGLDWSASEALAPMGAKAVVAASVEDAVRQVAAVVQSGDHVLCMSNGGFGGIHQKILTALA
jgi:UDP-N-acetylmuramate: L-alanyl-gamma-D-glutamyl-meso-diaminopimelate ligase